MNKTVFATAIVLGLVAFLLAAVFGPPPSRKRHEAAQQAAGPARSQPGGAGRVPSFADTAHPELKWIAGLFYWMSSVQDYDQGGWNYRARLKAYVDGGMTDVAFIDAVSGIVNRGCHNPPCGTGPLDGGADRRANFEAALEAMGLH